MNIKRKSDLRLVNEIVFQNQQKKLSTLFYLYQKMSETISHGILDEYRDIINKKRSKHQFFQKITKSYVTDL